MAKKFCFKEKFRNFILAIKAFFKNPKFQKVFYPCLYFLSAAVIVVSACFIFDSLYYKGVYVDGDSMNPTLIGSGERVHYGISDNHRKALLSLERFDVVTTLFPDSWHSGETTKIKRVWGFPGETLNLTYDNVNQRYTFTVSLGETETYRVTSSQNENDLYSFATARRVFRTQSSSGNVRNFTTTLGTSEYWVMGDNWNVSSDSYYNRGLSEKLMFHHLQGKVVRILGTGVIVNNKVTQKQRISNMYYF